MKKPQNPLNFVYLERWEKDGKSFGYYALTKDGKEHFTTDTDNDVPIFCAMTELNLSLTAHRTKAQVRYMRQSFLYSRYGMQGKAGTIATPKNHWYLIRNDETLHEFKKK